MSGFKVGAIIQARTASTRLPAKVLKKIPLQGKISVLEHVIRRVKKTSGIKTVIVATTRQKKDDALVNLAKKERVKVFRGSEEDVLSRYYFCARENSLATIIRITSDCPFIDPEVVDLVVKKHLDSGADYTSNTLARTFPRGFDVEAFSFQALKEAYYNARKPYQREHVTPYIYENKKSFKIAGVKAKPSLCAPGIRLTLDTIEDYALLCAVYAFLSEKNKFGIKEIVRLFRSMPQLNFINAGVSQKRLR